MQQFTAGQLSKTCTNAITMSQSASSAGSNAMVAFMALFRSKVQNFKRFLNCLHGVLNVVEKNCIMQMDGKSRDESNEPN